ncbi:hypothetical protein B484DRAFT_444120 [Ochromonadaceae sp. CCMP2298]|nr:hypothetical protein B484DRAFT_444120 [Ochromonadaceae sp. CCMP2298]
MSLSAQYALCRCLSPLTPPIHPHYPHTSAPLHPRTTAPLLHCRTPSEISCGC